jgi:hypothetical protein
VYSSTSTSSKPDSLLFTKKKKIEQGHCGQSKWQGQGAASACFFEAGICHWREHMHEISVAGVGSTTSSLLGEACHTSESL